jgi:hypothetical protein
MRDKKAMFLASLCDSGRIIASSYFPVVKTDRMLIKLINHPKTLKSVALYKRAITG